MDLKEVKAKTARWNPFRQVDLLGAFDFYTALITLDSLGAPDLEEVQRNRPTDMQLGKPLTADQYHALAKVMPLAVHEYTHFVESTSTIWGLRHLTLMNEAYLCDDRRGGREQDYAKAKAFFDHVRSIRLPDYYTLVDQNEDSTRPWQAQISVGKLFAGSGELSSSPVLFSRFTNASGKGLVRSLISMVSLLESSAMYQEVSTQAHLVAHCEADFRLVEERQFGQKTVNYFYDHRLTEYSVCAHIVANRLGCTDVGVALAYCALLVRISLNASESVFAELSARAPVAEILEIAREHEFVAAMLSGLRRGDRTVLFYLLASALPVDSLKRGAPVEGVKVALAALGLDLVELQKSAEQEAAKLAAALDSSRIGPIRALARAGLANMQIISLEKPSMMFSTLHLPAALLGDGSELHVFGGNGLEKFSISECFDELYAGQSWVERFSEACIF